MRCRRSLLAARRVPGGGVRGAGSCVMVEGKALGARAPIVEFDPRQGVTALGARVPVAELGP